uniref:Uncharacterized protein n=1 Tax=Arundo donax TaxID=35708 RepID=A0A0A8Z2V8_ARUDO
MTACAATWKRRRGERIARPRMRWQRGAAGRGGGSSAARSGGCCSAALRFD